MSWFIRAAEAFPFVILNDLRWHCTQVLQSAYIYCEEQLLIHLSGNSYFSCFIRKKFLRMSFCHGIHQCLPSPYQRLTIRRPLRAPLEQWMPVNPAGWHTRPWMKRCQRAWAGGTMGRWWSPWLKGLDRETERSSTADTIRDKSGLEILEKLNDCCKDTAGDHN